MRSPQLAQNLVSRPCHLASSASLRASANGWYHLRADGRRGMRGSPGSGAGLAGPRFAASPRWPTPTPALGPPSPPRRHAEDPARLRRVGLDGAPTTATARRRSRPRRTPRSTLLGSLPPSTQVGLRVFGGTSPRARSAPRARTRASSCRSARSTARRPSSRSARSRPRAARRSPTRSSSAAKDLGDLAGRARSSSSPTARTPASRRRRAQVAQRDRQGRREMRIQAIGFNVDQEARQELECIAAAGGGVYTRRRQTPRRCKAGAARALHARAAPVHRRRASRSRAARARARRPPIVPGPLHRQDAPGRRALVRDRPAPRRDAEGQRVVDPARRESPTSAAGAARSLDIVTPSFDDPRPPELVVGRLRRSSAAASSTASGVVSRPIGVGGQADADQPFSKPGRYYLKLALKDSDEKDALQRHRRPALRRRARDRGARPQRRQPAASKEPEAAGDAERRRRRAERAADAAVLTLVGGGLAAAGFAGAGVLTFRRRRQP